MKKLVDVGSYKVKSGSGEARRVSISFYGKSYKHWLLKREKNRGKYVDGTPDANSIDLEAILDEFHLKGFEFGNWLPQQERHTDVVSTVTSLNQLAALFGSKNLGIDGNVGVAFGARGSRGAAAHYEPALNMINLTRMNGAGCLAHEYGHALDFNFGSFVDQNPTYAALSGGRATTSPLLDNVGTELRALMNQICDSVRNTERYRSMSPKRGWNTSYYYRRTEIFARFFEQYVCYILRKQGTSNRLLTQSWEYYTSPLHLQYMSEEDFLKLKPTGDKLVRLMGQLMNNHKGVTLHATPYPKEAIIKAPVKIAKKEEKKPELKKAAHKSSTAKPAKKKASKKPATKKPAVKKPVTKKAPVQTRLDF